MVYLIFFVILILKLLFIYMFGVSECGWVYMVLIIKKKVVNNSYEKVIDSGGKNIPGEVYGIFYEGNEYESRICKYYVYRDAKYYDLSVIIIHTRSILRCYRQLIKITDF